MYCSCFKYCPFWDWIFLNILVYLLYFFYIVYRLLAAVSLNIEVFFQQKELEKAKKQAKEAALLQQCKNSIGKFRNKTHIKCSWAYISSDARCSWQGTSDLASCSTLVLELKSRLLLLGGFTDKSTKCKSCVMTILSSLFTSKNCKWVLNWPAS